MKPRPVLAKRLRYRVRWWRGARAYDKEHRQRYLCLHTLLDGVRCRHRTRLLGLRCTRIITYDSWCGLHNSLCWRHEPDGNRCDGRYANA